MSGCSTMPTVDPASPWIPHAARIRAMRAEVASVQTLELEFCDAEVAKRFRFLPGQFHMMYLPGIGESAISFSGDPADASYFVHTIRAVGNVTNAIARCRVGDTLFVRGPFGSPWPVEESAGHDLLVVAGGLGLAPLRPVVYQVARERERFGRVMVIHGARSPSDLLYRDEYAKWREAGIEVLETVDLGDAEWDGAIGFVTPLMRRFRTSGAASRVMACGPEIMMRFVAQEALSMGMDRQHIFLSMERNMSCAVGLCGHCQYGPVFICKDGPVFAYDILEPYLHVEDL